MSFIRASISGNYKKILWKDFQFWAIILISSILILIYLTWPWRNFNFNPGIWQWMNWLAPLYRLAAFEITYHVIGILFLVPVIYASIVFKWWGSLIGSLILFIYLFPLLIKVWNNFDSLFFNIIVLLLPVSIVTAIKIELELRRKDSEIYIEKAQEYQIYLAKILEIQEKERRRLAEDLHDGSVQTLLAIASYAESVELADDNITEMKTKAAWIKENIRRTVDDLRKISVDLRPSTLDDMGLISALKWLTAQSNKKNNIRVHLNINNLKQELQSEIEVNIFRIVQEALHNIEKHSQATDASINLNIDAESLMITIQDNGQGFVPPKTLGSLVTNGKLGLIGIQERTKSLGGTFEIRSAPKEGTLLSIRVPVQPLNSSQSTPLDSNISSEVNKKLTNTVVGGSLHTFDK